MKQFLLKAFSVFLAILLFNMQTFAFSLKTSTAITKSDIQSVAEFDDSEIYDAFAEISELDQYLAVNDSKSYTDVNQEDSALLNGISSTTSLPFSASADELALGIPSFLWGCVFGIVGVLVVYLMTDENKDQTKKAVYGCIASSVVGLVLYFTVFAVAATTTPAYTY